MNNSNQIFGYAGKILRINLTRGNSIAEELEEETLRKYIGGASLGMKFVYDEVPAGIDCFHPDNRLFIGSGPLGGTRIGGSGGIAVVTKGALTGGMTSTQANGFFGAFLKFSGYDGIILQGASSDWVYIYIHDDIVEFRNASHLVGKNTYQVDSLIRQDLQKKEREVSILSIGPAGENRVKFACIFIDMGHIAAHNGVGAVMGSKKLKAIAINRGKHAIPLKDKEAVSRLSKEILTNTLTDRFSANVAKEGTVGGVVGTTKSGLIPVKNYTTNMHIIDPVKLNTYTAQNIRSQFKAKPTPCWACPVKHCHMMEVTEGKYNGRQFEEPEYEDMAAFSALVGISDVTTSVVLANEVDRLGMDVNETGWVISWVIECYEKALLTKNDTEGLEMTWGNGDAIMEMLHKIAYRKGFGDVLAEGVMRAAQKIGGVARNFAIHTLKGNTPRTHDHRIRWFELFDTCVSNTGTMEAVPSAPYKALNLPLFFDDFDPIAVSTRVAKLKGAMIFEDSMITCRFQSFTAVDLLCQAVNAATGWDMSLQEAMAIGKRAVNLARVFNLRQGICAELDAPSLRYGSMPLDGMVAGKCILLHWEKMLQNYYNHMGWDKKGKPLPRTLTELGLESVNI